MSHINPPPFKLEPAILAEIRHQGRVYREHHDGLLPNTMDWRYLKNRWEVDPARFDHWHPLIGRWIAEDWHLTHNPPVASPDPPPVVIVPPPSHDVGSTPEPGSWVLLAIGILIVWMWRKRP